MKHVVAVLLLLKSLCFVLLVAHLWGQWGYVAAVIGLFVQWEWTDENGRITRF